MPPRRREGDLNPLDRAIRGDLCVICGRPSGNAWVDEECFKDYEVYADDGSKPLARGTLRMTSDPQRIAEFRGHTI